QWTASVARDANGSRVTAGLTNLVLMKTTDSSFAGFPRDEFTTLPDAGDRILATSLTASWTYGAAAAPAQAAGHSLFEAGDDDFSSAREAVRRALVETFAAHD